MFALNLVLMVTTAYFAKYAYDIGEYAAMSINLLGFVLNTFAVYVQANGTSTNNTTR